MQLHVFICRFTEVVRLPESPGISHFDFTLFTREDSVISALSTLGTRKYSVMSAFGTPETRQDSVSQEWTP